MGRLFIRMASATWAKRASLRPELLIRGCGDRCVSNGKPEDGASTALPSPGRVVAKALSTSRASMRVKARAGGGRQAKHAHVITRTPLGAARANGAVASSYLIPTTQGPARLEDSSRGVPSPGIEAETNGDFYKAICIVLVTARFSLVATITPLIRSAIESEG